MNIKAQKIFILIILASVGAGFFVGVQYQKIKSEQPISIGNLTNQELGKVDGVDFGLFWESWKRLSEKYVDRSKLDTQKMVYGAIEGMVSSLDDPYTVFLKPEQSKRFQEEIKGEFGGVGIEIGLRENILTVIAPIKGTPAYMAGILAGDKIVKIDEESTSDMTIDKAVSLIRGIKGTKVVLSIIRNGFEKPKEFAIIRDTIKIPTVDQRIIEDSIGYLELNSFNQNAGTEFKQAVNRLKNEGAKKIILDLRNNPGGLLNLAVDFASWFLEPNKVVVIEDFGNNKRNEIKSKSNGALKDTPLVILINRGSASASEILAGALHDQKGTILVGEKTFGKGSVQQVDELRGGASLKITIAKWLTPNGRSISDLGIEPDITVELTEKDKEANKDPQLDKAIEIIKSL